MCVRTINDTLCYECNNIVDKVSKECEVCHERLLKNTLASRKPSKTLLLGITKADEVDATSHKHN